MTTSSLPKPARRALVASVPLLVLAHVAVARAQTEAPKTDAPPVTAPSTSASVAPLPPSAEPKVVPTASTLPVVDNVPTTVAPEAVVSKSAKAGPGGSFMDTRLTWTFGDDDVLHRTGRHPAALAAAEHRRPPRLPPLLRQPQLALHRPRERVAPRDVPEDARLHPEPRHRGRPRSALRRAGAGREQPERQQGPLRLRQLSPPVLQDGRVRRRQAEVRRVAHVLPARHRPVPPRLPLRDLVGRHRCVAQRVDLPAPPGREPRPQDPVRRPRLVSLRRLQDRPDRAGADHPQARLHQRRGDGARRRDQLRLPRRLRRRSRQAAAPRRRSRLLPAGPVRVPRPAAAARYRPPGAARLHLRRQRPARVPQGHADPAVDRLPPVSERSQRADAAVQARGLQGRRVRLLGLDGGLAADAEPPRPEPAEGRGHEGAARSIGGAQRRHQGGLCAHRGGRDLPRPAVRAPQRAGLRAVRGARHAVSTKTQNEMFFAASIDHYLESLHLRPGIGGGVQLPATFSSEEPGRQCRRGLRTVIVRNQGNNVSILPVGATRKPIFQSALLAALGHLRDLHRGRLAPDAVQDPNATLVTRDPTSGTIGSSARSSRARCSASAGRSPRASEFLEGAHAPSGSAAAP